MIIKKLTRREIYAAHGIEYKAGKILAPTGQWIRPLLKEGNDKTGTRCYTFSLPAGTDGTCIMDCPDCYAKTGFYKTATVKASNKRNQMLVENYLEFVHQAILAQIQADKIEMVRIHASGDFHTVNSADYTKMWTDTVNACPGVRFWTYTKMQDLETLFDACRNANIVPSILPHDIGLNYGTCEYLLEAYRLMQAHGITPHICRCGIDENQHCENCAGCSKNKYVLFVKHSAEDYDAKKDPLLPEIARIIDAQDND